MYKELAQLDPTCFSFPSRLKLKKFYRILNDAQLQLERQQ